MRALDDMNIYNAIFPIFCLFVGVPCLLIPHKVQSFVLAFNERFGHQEQANSFRHTENYIRRLRIVGLITISGGVIVVLIVLFAEDMVRAVI